MGFVSSTRALCGIEDLASAGGKWKPGRGGKGALLRLCEESILLKNNQICFYTSFINLIGVASFCVIILFLPSWNYCATFMSI